jgi:hypothetical protein
MKALPKPVFDSTQLARLLTAAVPSRLLLSGIELDFFSHLDAALAANDVAKRLGTHVDNTRVFPHPTAVVVHSAPQREPSDDRSLRLSHRAG